MLLNRKYADLRHAPGLDPRVLRYDPASLPQALVRLGPGSRRKTKGGALIGGPGFTWALFFFPGRWYVVTSAFDERDRFLAHQVDVCVPPEERDGVLSFLDLKLDLLIPARDDARWLDHEDYEAVIRAGLLPLAWQEAVAETVATLDRDRAAGRFPPPEVRAFHPEPR